MEQTSVQRILNNPRYAELVAKRAAFSWLLTAIMLAIYFGYILTVAFAPGFIGEPMVEGGAASIGLPIGIGVILSAVILTAIYVWRANGEFDRLTHQILEDVK